MFESRDGCAIIFPTFLGKEICHNVVAGHVWIAVSKQIPEYGREIKKHIIFIQGLDFHECAGSEDEITAGSHSHMLSLFPQRP